MSPHQIGSSTPDGQKGGDHDSAASQAMQELVKEERLSITSRLSAVIPRETMVTLMLHQPLSPPVLVDVGPKPIGEDGEDKPVVQAIGSGIAGSFAIDPERAELLIPTEQEVTDGVVSSFRDNNPEEEVRRRHVAREKLRYKHVTFKSDDIPPLGATLHLLRMGPIARRLPPGPVPNLGLVYTVAPTVDVRNALVVASIMAGNIALEERFKLLVPDAGDALDQLLQPAAEGAEWLDRITWAVSQLLLAHHWFFPHCARVPHLISRTGVDPRRAYEDLGWPSPVVEVVGMRENDWPQDVTCLAGDIVELGMMISGKHGKVDEGALIRTRGFVFTALCLLFGSPTQIEGRSPSLTFGGTGSGESSTLLFWPDSRSKMHTSCTIPGLTDEALENSVRRMRHPDHREKEVARRRHWADSLRPGKKYTDFQPDGDKMTPELYVRSAAFEGQRLRLTTIDKMKNKPEWISRFTRLRLERSCIQGDAQSRRDANT